MNEKRKKEIKWRKNYLNKKEFSDQKKLNKEWRNKSKIERMNKWIKIGKKERKKEVKRTK